MQAGAETNLTFYSIPRLESLLCRLELRQILLLLYSQTGVSAVQVGAKTNLTFYSIPKLLCGLELRKILPFKYSIPKLERLLCRLELRQILPFTGAFAVQAGAETNVTFYSIPRLEHLLCRLELRQMLPFTLFPNWSVCCSGWS